MESGTKKIRKRSHASQKRRMERAKQLGILPQSAKEKELKEALAASQREVAVERAAAQRSEQQRQWAVEAGASEIIARVHMEQELKETEDLALHALDQYERADKQRTELYYQAESSNALAAKVLMESVSGLASETCKVMAKQRKIQVVEQAKSLRLTVKPHLTAAIQGHTPFRGK